MHCYLGIDEGTTGVTAVLFDESFTPLARGYQENRQYYPAPGLVEHDAEEIYENVLTAVSQALQKAGKSAALVTALGLDHEGESVVAWDRETGRPICPVIVWQDRRTDGVCRDMARQNGALIEACTGLSPDAYFSASKMAWILQNVPRAKELAQTGRLAMGNMDAFLAFRLSGGKVFATDVSTASRTMLMDLKTGQWDERMLKLWNIPREVLPDIRDSAFAFGSTAADAFFGAEVPIGALLCDQQAALLGNRCFEKGSVKTTYGTGCFMLMNTADKPVRPQNGLLPTAAWRMDGSMQYALDGAVYTAGAAVQWLRDGLKLIEDAAQTEEMANSLEDNGDVYFVPAFSGLAAPYWNPGARGMLIGLTGGTTDAHVVRAVLESCAYQVRDVLDAMQKDSGTAISQMKCDGGMTRNRFLMQFQADILGRELYVSDFPDVTALGSAMAAAHALGAPLPANPLPGKVYRPKMTEARRAEKIGRWRQAVARSKDWVGR